MRVAGVIRAVLGAAWLLALPVVASAQEFRLLMIEQAGCVYCAAFNRDVAPAYENSPEGTIAPLIRADLRGPMPEGVTLASLPFVTPTFILLDPSGTEVGRLIGYPGADFFWPYLGEMLDHAGALPAG